VIYYGDSKLGKEIAAQTRGNKVLLGELALYRSGTREQRGMATPLLFFRRVNHLGKKKGYVVFEGYGVIERAEMVVQRDFRTGKTFANYAFHCATFSLAAENELFDWAWINSRRNPSLTADQTLTDAPYAWREWVEHGDAALPNCRRRVSGLQIISKAEQLPAAGTREEKALRSIYAFYAGKKHRFEGLAAKVTGRIIAGTTGTFTHGWITAASGDGGIDFVGRIDLGSQLSTVSIIVLGQAKCEQPGKPTNGGHIARTVARLRRGWIGSYVTTSFFSASVQREVNDDRYPLLLVPGGRLAREVI